MAQIATHDGIVTEVSPQLVKVQIKTLSACSSCKAHEKCGFTDKADKIIEVETSEWKHYEVGDSVTVSVNEGLGLQAVLLAYLLPAVLLIAAVVVMNRLTHSEPLVALVPILIVAAYYLVLYRFRHNLQKKFSFGIEERN